MLGRIGMGWASSCCLLDDGGDGWKSERVGDEGRREEKGVRREGGGRISGEVGCKGGGGEVVVATGEHWWTRGGGKAGVESAVMKREGVGVRGTDFFSSQDEFKLWLGRAVGRWV